MAIDFEKMEDEFRNNAVDYDEDEQEEILEDIEKLKAMPEAEIQEIMKEWESTYHEELVESDDGDASNIADGKMLKLYLEAHPHEDEYEYNEALFDNFLSDNQEKRNSLTLEAILNGGAMRDNVYDMCARTATDKVAQIYEIHREVIRMLNPGAL